MIYQFGRRHRRRCPRSDNVLIGSNYPTGSASTATVTLAENEFASSVLLGYGSGTTGTLDLGDFKLTLGNSLYIGYGGTATVLRGSGYFSVSNLYVDSGNSFTLRNSRYGDVIIS